MKTFLNQIELLKSSTVKLNSIHKPFFFRIYLNLDLDKLNKILLTPGIIVIDFIEDQLNELIKYKNPSLKFTPNDLKKEVVKHIDKLSIYEYGVWVYYPWTNRLVHVLDEEEFVEVRTSRNQYKITKEEKAILAKKIVGVIGLSVGQSVSVTIAMERICNEIRLADFDLLELTNLNRIRTGVHNLGLAKVYSVAREISEIDPFLKVVCYPEGLIESNMDDFFLKDGKLDLLIEESDGFDIKILSRYKARELGIPVVMEASDRCTVDVERFDLEPNRSILHGLVDHLDIDKLKQLKTTEEKIPYMLDVLGIETSSLRLKASMLEIEQTINTWPQLASAVTMGGGIATDVSRRLLLNQFTDSGRYHLDIEELIGNKNKVVEPKYIENKIIESISLSEMKSIVENLSFTLSKNSIVPTEAQIRSIVEAATAAPSGGNAQAWKWYYTNGSLFLFHDVKRSESLLDFEHIASYISFGAATENLHLKSLEIGLYPFINTFPIKSEPRLICHYTFLKEPSYSNSTYNHLVSEINNRQTNRTISVRQIIQPNLLQELNNIACSIEGAQMHIIDNIEGIEKIAEIVSTVERLRMMHPRGHSDFVKEIRWTNEENELKRDGIDLNTVDITAAEKAGFIVAKNWQVVDTLKKWNKGSALEKVSKKTVLSASAMCLITMPEYSPLSYFNGGRSLQRTWLAANKMNISFQPQSPATFFFSRLIHGEGLELDNDLQKELSKLRNEFVNIFDLESNTNDVFLFRLCISDQPKVKSLRRKLEDIITFANTK